MKKKKKNKRISSGHPEKILLGSTNTNEFGSHSILITVSRVISHPLYKLTGKYNDIGLIELNKTIKFNEFIRPACLNIDENFKWTQAIASGYGQTSFGWLFLSFIY